MSKKQHVSDSQETFCPGPTTPGGNGLYSPPGDQLINDLSLFKPEGKIILANFSFPSADAIYSQKNNSVSRQFLREYLSFLEVVVIYEELLVVNQPYWVTKEEYNNPKSPIHLGFGHFDFAGDANLYDKIIELRSSESWIKDTLFDLPGIEVDPTVYAAQTRAILSKKETELEHPPHVEDLLDEIFHRGQAFAAFQIAQELSMPFYGPKVEYHPLVLKKEEATTKVQKNVISIMKERLDLGAKAILKEISKYNNQLQFNTSPIAALIIEKSNRPQDMLTVALDLRNKYEPFRQSTKDLEATFYSSDVSIQEKMKAITEIERVMDKVWGKNNGGLDRYIKSSGSLVDYALNFHDESFSVKKATDALISAPVELTIEKIRNRKYRLLFDARDNFLKQPSVKNKIAKLFTPGALDSAEITFDEVCCKHWWL